MQQNEWVNQFNSQMASLVEEYVQEQDFHAIETPLKTEKQIKNELRNNLLKDVNFKAMSRGILNALSLINAHLLAFGDQKQIEEVGQELDNAFIKLGDMVEQYSQDKLTDNTEVNQLDQNVPLWTALYGISDETLIMIYDIVLKCFENNEIENAKDLLQILLMFAPTIPAYWNAKGFCLQIEGNLDQALKNYLIAEEIDQDLLDTHFYLARCHMAMNNKLLAQEEVEKLTKLIAASKELKEEWENDVEQLANEISN